MSSSLDIQVSVLNGTRHLPTEMMAMITSHLDLEGYAKLVRLNTIMKRIYMPQMYKTLRLDKTNTKKILTSISTDALGLIENVFVKDFGAVRELFGALKRHRAKMSKDKIGPIRKEESLLPSLHHLHYGHEVFTAVISDPYCAHQLRSQSNPRSTLQSNEQENPTIPLFYSLLFPERFVMEHSPPPPEVHHYAEYLAFFMLLSHIDQQSWAELTVVTDIGRLVEGRATGVAECPTFPLEFYHTTQRRHRLFKSRPTLVHLRGSTESKSKSDLTTEENEEEEEEEEEERENILYSIRTISSILMPHIRSIHSNPALDSHHSTIFEVHSHQQIRESIDQLVFDSDLGEDFHTAEELDEFKEKVILEEWNNKEGCNCGSTFGRFSVC